MVGGVRVISAGEADFTRRLVVGDVGSLYFAQLAGATRSGPLPTPIGPLETGFIDWVETAVFGPPSLTLDDIFQGQRTRRPAEDDQDWSLLVRHNAANRGGSLDWSFRMDMSFRASQPRYQDYAEGWSLVGLLNKQPAKFGRLLLELKKRSSKRGSELAAIKKVYGWDDKKLTQEWRKYVMAKGPIGPEPNAAPAETAGQLAADGAKPPAGDVPAAPVKVAGGEKDTRLALKDIQELRRQRVSPEQVLDKVAEQGRGFEVPAEVVGELRRLGFRRAEIDAVKEASAEPLVPGKWLLTTDAQREEVFKEMKQVALKSGAAIEPIQSQHVTLWAAKEIQKTYLPDLQKLEKFFHTKCAEPIRSGLDKRSTHVVLLKNHAEYVSWFQTMFKLFGKEFDERNGPGGDVHIREQIFQRAAFYGWDVFAISVEDVPPQWVRRNVAASVGSQYVIQLAVPPSRQFSAVLHTGFANGAETVVCGAPSVMFSTIIYGQGIHSPGRGGQDWDLLVQQRMASNQATPVRQLLQMGTNQMFQPHYAEGWTLVGLLNKQPAKFGKLLLALKKGSLVLTAIEKIYGWDEKKLANESAPTRCTRSDSSERG